MKKNIWVLVSGIMIAGTLSFGSCSKETKSNEIWRCSEEDAYTITMDVDRSSKKVDCSVQKTTEGEQFELLFEDGKTYNYSVVSDSIVMIEPMGEFRYYVVSSKKVELKYNGMLNTSNLTIDTYTFKKN